MDVPIGLDGVDAAREAREAAGYEPLWDPFGLFHEVWRYRCRYCRAVLTTDDPGCGTCGAPAERQYGVT